MSLETLITTIATQLAKQRRRSVKEDEGCMYRGPQGSKCAIGAIIPDNLYSPLLEGSQLDSLMWVADHGEAGSDQVAAVALVEYLPTLAPELSAATVLAILSAFQDFHDDLEYNDEFCTFSRLLEASTGLTEAELAEEVNKRLTAIASKYAGPAMAQAAK